MELPEIICNQVDDLSEEGNDLFDQSRFSAATEKWSAALELLPEPKTDWEAYTWLSASIGDANYQLGKLDEARISFFDALNGPEGQSNPFIHYRLGQCEIKLENQDKGVEHLLRAYMLDGDSIFTGEADGAAFLDILKNRGLV